MILELFGISNSALVFLCTLAFLAGMIKGVVGFALPMILLSGLTLMMPAHIALGTLILPTVVSNVLQGFQQSLTHIKPFMKQLRFFLIIGASFLCLGAFMAPYMPLSLFLGLLGGVIVFFSLQLLLGINLIFQPHNQKASAIIASFAGFLGGMSGVWGPPVVAYLTALNTPKEQQIQIQGVIYGCGALLLLLAHTISGIFNWSVAPLSALLVIPTLCGVYLGAGVRHRLNQSVFRIATLILLFIAGLNLLRRAALM